MNYLLKEMNRSFCNPLIVNNNIQQVEPVTGSDFLQNVIVNGATVRSTVVCYIRKLFFLCSNLSKHRTPKKNLFESKF